MPQPSSLFARSAPPGEAAVPGGYRADGRSRTTHSTHPSSGVGSSLFTRSARQVRTVALDDIVDDLLVGRLTRLTHLDHASPAAGSGADDNHDNHQNDRTDRTDQFDDLDDVVALDLLDDDFDGERFRSLDVLLDLDEIDARHAATPEREPNDGETFSNGDVMRQSRLIRSRWDVRARRLGLDQRSDPSVDLRDHFAITDCEVAESLTCLAEWLLARPTVTDLDRAVPRGLFSLHALGRAGVVAGQARVPGPLDPFFTFET